MSSELIPFGEWPDLKQYGRESGKLPVATMENLQFLLNRLRVTVKYNVISKDLEISDPDNKYGCLDGGKNAAINAIISLCARYGLPKDNVPGFLEAIGYKNQFNPVLDWIQSRPYDYALNYIEIICESVTARFDFDPNFKNVLIKKWLLSCVAMLCNDDGNNWSKGVLTFQGKQNIGKTSWFWSLIPPKFKHWAEEGLTLNPAEKDSVTAAIRNWLVELGELEGTFKRSDISRLKGFLTKKTDTLRMPYDRKESTFPRRTAFFASVNQPTFLNDMTGNSRFWVIPVVAINYKHGVDVQQMWAQLLEAYKQGYQWNLTDNENKKLDEYNENAREMHPIEEMILQRIPFGRAKMTATDVLLAIGYDKPKKSDLLVCAEVMRKIFGDPVNERSGRFYETGKSWAKN